MPKAIDDYGNVIELHRNTLSCALNNVCENCGLPNPNIDIQHRNTMFPDDRNNYAAFCPSCRQDDDEYYDERWKDYYSDIYAGLF